MSCDNGGNGGSDNYDRTIEELFKRVKDENLFVLRAYGTPAYAGNTDRIITYCNYHDAWETLVWNVGWKHGEPPIFTLAEAVAIEGWYYATEDNIDPNAVASIPGIISVLDSFYDSKYKTNQPQFNTITTANGETLRGWYRFLLDRNGSGLYGGQAGESVTPCMAERYLFN